MGLAQGIPEVLQHRADQGIRDPEAGRRDTGASYGPADRDRDREGAGRRNSEGPGLVLLLAHLARSLVRGKACGEDMAWPLVDMGTACLGEAVEGIRADPCRTSPGHMVALASASA
jgi:hypothetical protein